MQSRVATGNRKMWRTVLHFQVSFTVKVRLGATVEWCLEAAHGSVRLEPSVHPVELRWGLKLSACLAIQSHSLSTDVSRRSTDSTSGWVIWGDPKSPGKTLICTCEGQRTTAAASSLWWMCSAYRILEHLDAAMGPLSSEFFFVISVFM